jgi:hypothetical protein
MTSSGLWGIFIYFINIVHIHLYKEIFNPKTPKNKLSYYGCMATFLPSVLFPGPRALSAASGRIKLCQMFEIFYSRCPVESMKGMQILLGIRKSPPTSAYNVCYVHWQCRHLELILCHRVLGMYSSRFKVSDF